MTPHAIDGPEGEVVAMLGARNGAWLVEWSREQGCDVATSLEDAAMIVLSHATDHGFVGPFRLSWLGQRQWCVGGGWRTRRSGSAGIDVR